MFRECWNNDRVQLMRARMTHLRLLSCFISRSKQAATHISCKTAHPPTLFWRMSPFTFNVRIISDPPLSITYGIIFSCCCLRLPPQAVELNLALPCLTWRIYHRFMFNSVTEQTVAPAVSAGPCRSLPVWTKARLCADLRLLIYVLGGLFQRAFPVLAI